jgi:hypothetical protein
MTGDCAGGKERPSPFLLGLIVTKTASRALAIALLGVAVIGIGFLQVGAREGPLVATGASVVSTGVLVVGPGAANRTITVSYLYRGKRYFATLMSYSDNGSYAKGDQISVSIESGDPRQVRAGHGYSTENKHQLLPIVLVVLGSLPLVTVLIGLVMRWTRCHTKWAPN